MINCAFNLDSYFLKIFTVMCFVEPIVRLFIIRICTFICYSNMYILLFTKVILLDTIYLLKFLRSCFYSIICTLVIIDNILYDIKNTSHNLCIFCCHWAHQYLHNYLLNY